MRFAPQSRIHLTAPFALAVSLSTTWPNKLNERVAKTILSAKLNRKANDKGSSGTGEVVGRRWATGCFQVRYGYTIG